MGKGQDAKKTVKKEATKTAKEKKAEKRLKKASKGQPTGMCLLRKYIFLGKDLFSLLE